MNDIIKSFLLRAPSKLLKAATLRAKSKNYSLNQYISELLATSSSTEGLRSSVQTSPIGEFLNSYVSRIKASFGSDVIGVILFGSFARGDFSQSSDIDLLLVLSESATLDRDTYQKLPAISFAGHEVSPLIVKLPANDDEIRSIWFEVALEGVVIYCLDQKLLTLLIHTRKSMIEGRAARHYAYGTPYWIAEGSQAK